MERYVTQPQTLRFKNFSFAILLCLLIFNCTHANATDIVSNAAKNVKLTSATLSATIAPSESTVLEKGFFWGTASGVTIDNNKVSVGGTSGGSFSVDVTGLNRSKTIYFKSYYKEVDGTVILSTELSFSNVPIFSGEGEWTEVDHWNVKEIPGIVAGDSIVIDGECEIDDLTINAGAKLTINAGKVLNVTGTLINTDVAGLILKSEINKPNATLTYMSGSPVATVEMYSKASWNLGQQEGSVYSWQYFGIPVVTFPLSTPAFQNSIVRKHVESSTDNSGLWEFQTNSSSLSQGLGYEIVQANPTTYSFTGALTNKDFVQNIYYNSTAIYPGQNVISNPYTAAIDISNFFDSFNVDTEKSIYLFNTGTYNEYLDNGSSTPAGYYEVSTPGSVGTLGVPNQIPSMQGFVIKTSNNGLINMDYSDVIIQNTAPQKIPGVIKINPSDKIATRIDLSGSHIADRLWLFTDPSCSPEYDKGWDGYKMAGSVKMPQLFAREETGDFQIDAVADIDGTFLGFNAGDETNYKLTFTHLNAENRYKSIFLVDIMDNITTDITASGSEYAFKAIATTAPVKRFKIVTSPQIETNTNLTVDSKLKVYNSNGTLFVQNLSNQSGNLILYTMNGVAVSKIDFKANIISTISTTNLQPGVYVAKAFSNQEMVTEKIIIR